MARFTELGEFHRGYAYKDEKGRWHNPKNGRIISSKQAMDVNETRRSQLTIKDAWESLKIANPQLASKMGWNRFQKYAKGAGGNREQLVKQVRSKANRTKTLKMDRRTTSNWALQARGDNRGFGAWGNSF